MTTISSCGMDLSCWMTFKIFNSSLNAGTMARIFII